jgi:hypothetical protein
MRTLLGLGLVLAVATGAWAQCACTAGDFTIPPGKSLKLSGGTSGAASITAAATGSPSITLPSAGIFGWPDAAGWGGGVAYLVQRNVGINTLTLGADVGLTTLFTPTSNQLFQICAATTVTRAATGGSPVLPQIQIKWTETDSNTAIGPITMTTCSPACSTNALGTNSQGCIFIYAKSGVAVQYQTTAGNYGTGTTMQYSLHIRTMLLDT